MHEAIQKADVLIEALGWIRRFRDKITVIKLGGSVMQDEDALRHVLLDIVFMETVGMRPVVVHGAGAAISKAMTDAGLEARFVLGRRVTDDPALKIVEQVLAGTVNNRLHQFTEELGGRSAPLNFATQNVLFGEKLTLTGEDGNPVELGNVGVVTKVDSVAIKNICADGRVPIIPSMCIDSAGQKYNVNADTAATAVAQALSADKLVFLSDVNGVRRDKDAEDSIIHTLPAAEARKLIANGSIGTGMIPKVEACLETLEQGVGKVHIIDGRLRHSLLLEIYTNTGVGTLMVK